MSYVIIQGSNPAIIISNAQTQPQRQLVIAPGNGLQRTNAVHQAGKSAVGAVAHVLVNNSNKLPRHHFLPVRTVPSKLSTYVQPLHPPAASSSIVFSAQVVIVRR